MIQGGNVVGSEALAMKPIERTKREVERVSIFFSTFSLARLTIHSTIGGFRWLLSKTSFPVPSLLFHPAHNASGSILPTILAGKKPLIYVSVSETSRDYVIIYKAGLAGVALGALLIDVPHIGHSNAMLVSSSPWRYRSTSLQQ